MEGLAKRGNPGEGGLKSMAIDPKTRGEGLVIIETRGLKVLLVSSKKRRIKARG